MHRAGKHYVPTRRIRVVHRTPWANRLLPCVPLVTAQDEVFTMISNPRQLPAFGSEASMSVRKALARMSYQYTRHSDESLKRDRHGRKLPNVKDPDYIDAIARLSIQIRELETVIRDVLGVEREVRRLSNVVLQDQQTHNVV